MTNQEELEKELSEAARKLSAIKYVGLIFHDDADGICAAAITKSVLDNIKAKYELICLEKLYPEAIQALGELNIPLLFVDLASPHADLIVAHTRTSVIILDHHEAKKTKLEPNIININPCFHGFDGGTECSASTLCFLFARNFLDHAALVKAAELAVIGAVGDVQKFVTLNEIPYKLTKVKAATTMARKLTILGSVGYYKDGPIKAVDAALQGFTNELNKEVNELEQERKKRFAELREKLTVKQSKHFSYFHTMETLSDLGVKVIGSFCSYLSFQAFRFGIRKPLLGFMAMRKEIPGLGMLRHDYVKVSARIPKGIKVKINLGELLQQACAEFGGIGEGHAAAASGVLLKGKEESFINRMDELAEELK